VRLLIINFQKVFLTILTFAVTSFTTQKPSSTVLIQFKNFVGDSLMDLDKTTYKNELGQEYTLSKFKYYISNIQLMNASGKNFSSKECFLVNEDKKESLKLSLDGIEAGEYSSISFLLGVDSVRNCSGIQDGALDPVQGMFWAWNTGYIFLKIEGHSPVSQSPGRIFEYHIGGYKEPVNSIRKIELKFKNGMFHVEDGKNAKINIKADAAEVFKNPVEIDFLKLSSVTDLSNAKMIADNYADMFSIIEN
jgi:hypothetical protein